MRQPRPTPTGVERTFGTDEIIVSKTDLKGRITYANRVFLRVAGYTEDEVIGQPHSIMRHPEMPRVVFDLMWQTIRSGAEIFAYVNNLASDGANYWVLAHITPTFVNGQVVGYHSNRRSPDRAAVSSVSELYATLLGVERQHAKPADAIEAAAAHLATHLATVDQTYDEFVWSLIRSGQSRAA